MTYKALLVKNSSAGKFGKGTGEVLATSDRRMRHYVHGDQSETNRSEYYCRLCGWVDATHFAGEHGTERYELALDHIELWNKVTTEHPDLRRSKNAANILEAEARRRRSEIEARRSPFHRWLESQKGRNDSIGDLAQDVLGDLRFPAAVKTLPELREYLQSRFACTEAVPALNQAWSEFTGAV